MTYMSVSSFNINRNMFLYMDYFLYILEYLLNALKS